MANPNFDAFMAGIGNTISTFKIHERLGISLEDCYDILTTKQIDNRWAIRSILINELAGEDVRQTISSNNPENLTGKFTVAHMIKRISEYTGQKDNTLIACRNQMLHFLHEDTQHLLYLFDPEVVPPKDLKAKLTPAYVKAEGDKAQAFIEAFKPYIIEVAQKDSPNLQLTHYADAIGADKSAADKLIDEVPKTESQDAQAKSGDAASNEATQKDSVTSKKPSASKATTAKKKSASSTTGKGTATSKKKAAPKKAASSAKNDAVSKVTKKESKPVTKKPATKRKAKVDAAKLTPQATAISPRPGHMMRTKLANQIQSLPDASRDHFVTMIKAFVSSDTIKPELDYNRALETLGKEDVVNNIDLVKLAEEASPSTLASLIDMKTLIANTTPDVLAKAVNMDKLLSSTKAKQYIDEKGVVETAGAVFAPSLDDYVNSLTPAQKASIAPLIEAMAG